MRHSTADIARKYGPLTAKAQKIWDDCDGILAVGISVEEWWQTNSQDAEDVRKINAQMDKDN